MEPVKPSILMRGWVWFKKIPSKPLPKLHEVARQAMKVAKDDPRRSIHSLKVGIALTLVSLLYYLKPLYNNFGASAMWAVMTVVVVFEFSVGATIGKGLNRGLATLAAAALALGAHHLASITGKNDEPYLLGLFVFIQAISFIRFFPKVKAKYDYGMLVFIITFCLISISGFRTNELVKMAQARLVTTLIGASICLAVCILIYPVWAGEDLHKFVAQNIGQLGNFLEGHMDQCFRTSCDANTEMRKPSTINLNSILMDSKGREETLANLAGWEPGHGKFMYRHPWKQYLKIGNLTRQCACRLEALNTYLNSNLQLQAPREIQCAIRDSFSESGKALKEVARAVETMTKPTSSTPRIANLKITTTNLKSELKSCLGGDRNDFLQTIPVAAAMIDAASIVEQIAEAVNELSLMAKFRSGKGDGGEGETEMDKDKSCIEIGMAEIPNSSVYD